MNLWQLRQSHPNELLVLDQGEWKLIERKTLKGSKMQVIIPRQEISKFANQLKQALIFLIAIGIMMVYFKMSGCVTMK
jgi:hypothetical protein